MAITTTNCPNVWYHGWMNGIAVLSAKTNLSNFNYVEKLSIKIQAFQENHSVTFPEHLTVQG